MSVASDSRRDQGAIHNGFSVLAILCLIAILASACFTPSSTEAFADETNFIVAEVVHQSEIEALEDAHKTAEKNLMEAKARVAENQAKVDAIMRKLPAQQERSDEAMRQIYIMEDNKLLFIESLLDSETLDDFFKMMEYYDRINRKNLDELNKSKAMKAELDAARVLLDATQYQAEEQERIAQEALRMVQDQRAAKQSGGQSTALSQDGNGAVVDGANWYMSEEEFVAEWAPRIDAYLAGSPMEGTGVYFAEASFRYCVDPRWSPAISNTESSKGRVCIRPHNAWGWGAADSNPYALASEWGSWEEAIDAHVRGLANGYGYTISKSAAQSYCSTPDSWYANTISEMAQI